jgi:hypothetical protein
MAAFMRRKSAIRRIPLIIAVAAASACSGADPTTGSAPTPGSSFATPTPHVLSAPATPSAATAPTTIHKIIRPSGQTIVLVTQSIPNADCSILNAELAASPPQNSRAFASDELGQVRLFVDPGNTDGEPINVILDCLGQDDSTSLTPIEFDVGDNVALADEILTPHGIARPALAGDPMSYTQEQLISAGFPPRPDPSKSTTSYANWLRIASHAATQITNVTPHLHGSRSSACTGMEQCNTFWSGDVATTTSYGSWELVDAIWDVPSVTGQYGSGCPSTVQNSASLWDGLGGWGANSLIQGVSFLNVVTSRSSSCATSHVATYSAHAEYWAGNGTGQDVQVGSFGTNPGDEIQGEAWSSSSSSCYPFSTNGAYGCYYVYDYTNNQYVSTSIPAPTAAGSLSFNDVSAEWIMENPGSAGQFLANYDNASIAGGEVDTTTQTNVPAYDLSPIQVLMVATANSNTLLSWAGLATYPNDTIAFEWENSGP